MDRLTLLLVGVAGRDRLRAAPDPQHETEETMNTQQSTRTTTDRALLVCETCGLRRPSMQAESEAALHREGYAGHIANAEAA